MDRPNILDEKTLKYVEYLEERLKAFSSEETTAKSYKALKKFIDTNAETLADLEINSALLSDKDDRIVDRSLKFAKELLDYNKDLQELAEKISPELKEESREVRSKRTADRHAE